ncbi:MAG: D-alanyl-D-alanine carboxypeptidase [Peptococcaceae bacterium]|nr:D-alanyl-D-alanine carboxypeptidase [Peptococcaceae bacterium]
MLKDLCCILLLMAFCLSIPVVPPAWAEPEQPPTSDVTTAKPVGLETTAEAAVLMDPISGKVLFEKNKDKRLPIASVTKIMTMLLTVEAISKGEVSLEDTVKASENAAGMGGSQIFLAPEEEFSLYEMLVSIATSSANDASVAVAEHLCGTVEEFVQKMNEKAKQLGLKNTHFINPTGLPAEGHYSSAYDQAIILREAMKYPIFRKVSKIKEYDLRGGKFKLWNTNKLLWWYEGADIGKTGWTNEAKYCLSSSAERNGLRLITVVLGCPEPKSHFRESMKIYNWGFAKFQAVTFAQAGDKIKTIAIDKGTSPTVDLVTPRKIAVVVPKGQTKGIDHYLDLPERLTAPLERNQVVGHYIVTKNGTEILRFEILTKQQVDKATLQQEFFRVINRICS